MNAWLLTALLCARASAAVVETAVVVAPVSGGAAVAGAAAGATLSPIPAVPGASVLAPSLNSAVIRAFPAQPASAIAAGAVRLAPPLSAAPAASAAHAPSGRGEAAPAPEAAPSRSLPPETTAARGKPSAAAPATSSRDGGHESAVGALATRLGAADRAAARTLGEAGLLERVPDEGAAALGGRVFDRTAERALLTGTVPASADASVPGAAKPAAAEAAPLRRAVVRAEPRAAFAPEGEALRDAVASPFPAGAASRAAAFSAPNAAASGGFERASVLAPRAAAPSIAAPEPAPSFERLSLELGSGLVVKVRSALGLEPATAAARPFAAATKDAPARASRASSRAPVTSTEWLERRGLLETLSASEAAAVQTAALVAAPRSSAPLAPISVPAPSGPQGLPPLALWGLAFLPAAAVLLKELL